LRKRGEREETACDECDNESFAPEILDRSGQSSGRLDCSRYCD
jgi:hypothetical protein